MSDFSKELEKQLGKNQPPITGEDGELLEIPDPETTKKLLLQQKLEIVANEYIEETLPEVERVIKRDVLFIAWELTRIFAPYTIVPLLIYITFLKSVIEPAYTEAYKYFLLLHTPRIYLGPWSLLLVTFITIEVIWFFDDGMAHSVEQFWKLITDDYFELPPWIQRRKDDFVKEALLIGQEMEELPQRSLDIQPLNMTRVEKKFANSEIKKIRKQKKKKN